MAPTASSPPSGTAPLDRRERAAAVDHQLPRAAVLHETVRLSGEEELGRGAAALAWSALAAGLTMGFSMLARALMHRHLEGVPGRFLLESLGYCFGFLAVILARQQLFTENTLTAVLPLLSRPSAGRFVRLLRLWGIVLAGNLVGAGLFAWGLLHLDQFDAATHAAFRSLGEEVLHNETWSMFSKGLLAGWVIAMMVWMLAAAEQARLAIILACTWVVGIGGFTHVVVGSAEVLYLVFAGLAGSGDYLRFALPTLAGNVVGGSLIFALISHAQVRSEQV